MTRGLLIAVMVCFASCSKSPKVPVSAKPLANTELNAFMLAQGFPFGHVADAGYDLPERGWLEYDFGRALMQDYMDNGFLYAPNSWDCDKFALEAVALMHRLHYANRSTLNGIAFGELWYRRPTGEAHAINFGLLWVDGVIKIMFYEPQSFEDLRLGPSEIASVDFWRI